MPDLFPRALYTEKRIITDGNIITAQGYAFVDFAFAIAKHLGDTAGQEDEYEGFFHQIMNR